ncbi:ABC transporter substrate-binding protein [Bordetella parapertussis]|uniref:ABC transporter, periplasmic solute-binding protein n=2 Tax=Bordetella parapertussis TaxID=519 RepID=Q7W6V8_BORPA|nr:ABC transporter substrate-binding protein [Bordetella parapertussis]AOB39826.1 ABC transporter substrate-binding protein [Bordetella parapertussis]AUL43837.1 ABC transporter substrate-binding protein [Bordetella parapertussis]AWP62649.1 ABC transporter substrate-binding protein [Bordetella parapertussis]AWP70147.1 ABC transporter substrate-binding protein [Bordetella parapertussis]AWP89845.1 ABC transporter substrate-binding protein [Bordetella parapertussis]
MNITQRFAKWALAASMLGASAAVPAQDITMATWGGGVGKAWREAYAEPFMKASKLEVKIVEVPTPEAQVRAQKGAPKFNAVLSSLFEAAQMYEDGLLEDFDMADFPALKNMPDKYLLKAPNGRLIGVSTYFAYYGIAVNTDLAKPADFASWKNLADPKWAGKLSVTRPVYSSAYDLTIMSVAEGGSERDTAKGLELLTALGKNALTMYSSMAQMNQLLQRGEVAAAPYYSTRIWQMQRDGQRNVELVVPKEGALMLPYLVVVPKGAQGREHYMKWLEYVGQPEGQQRIAEIAGYMPLNSQARLSPAAEKELGQPLDKLRDQLYQPDWNLIAKTRKTRIEAVERAMAGAAR